MFTGRHRTDGMVVVLVLLSACCARTQADKFAGGTGEPGNPYRIVTAAQLTAIGSDPDLLGKHYELMADIDLAGICFSHAPIAFDTNEAKADFQGTAFGGTFNGRGHRIYHLTIAGNGYLGLFGRIGGGLVLDLALENVAIIGKGPHIGALAGHNANGWVLGCYSTGSVVGGSNVGGLVGCNDYKLANCYSTCFVSGGTCGGLVGHNGATGRLTNGYSRGLVVGGSTIGGLVGSSDGAGAAANCFWDTQTSCQAHSGSGTGKTTAQMQTPATFLAAGWDFRAESANGWAQTWQMPDSGGYPELSVFGGYLPALPGCGDVQNPYVVATAADLAAVCHLPLACYKLTATIDLDQTKWSMPLVPVFYGTFDGNGHTIQHLTLRAGDYAGVFGLISSGAQIKRLGVEDVNVAGTSYVGGLVGSSGGSLTGCFSTGNATGASYVGGLVGDNWGMVTDCYSQVIVVATSSCGGGLTGRTSGNLSNCYSTGLVSGTTYCGGLLGYAAPDSTTANCFWDVITSGRPIGGAGLGLSSLMMKRMSTYLLFGWDFVGETANGAQDLWRINDGKDYPRLAWQATKN